MPVSVTMPQLGESVTEGTVTRWLKKEGDHVDADEPLLEVSTDKVDTEIPSPASGTLHSITVAEDETVEVGAELAVIGEGDEQTPAATEEQPGAGAQDESAPAPAEPTQAEPAAAESEPAESAQDESEPAESERAAAESTESANGASASSAAPSTAIWESEPASAQTTQATNGEAESQQARTDAEPPAPAETEEESAPSGTSAPSTAIWEGEPQAAPSTAIWESEPPAATSQAQEGTSVGTATPSTTDQSQPGGAAPSTAIWESEPRAATAEGPYVTPLVRKLAAEHNVDLNQLQGTGVGGRIRKQDVLEAARVARERQAAVAPAPAQQPARTAKHAAAPTAAPAQQQAAAPPVTAEPSPLRGQTEKMSRMRQVIAQRMVESLQTSAQLTTVVEVDVSKIARLRDRAKADFLAREGVKLSFLPFFALAAVEALKVHPKLNAVIDTEKKEVVYHDAEHLTVAVDTDRGLSVPVIKNAGDLNLAALARKIADLAERTRTNQVSPDELSGGTFTVTNTGSRGALFDTPIINQPQVGILGTGAVVKRPVVVDDPDLGEAVAVRSMVYLALTYDHRLVDGADAARFLQTVKQRLEEGQFEAELGLV